jgi:TPR repeat protein
MKKGILALAFLAAPCMAASLEDTLTAVAEGNATAQEQLGVMYARGQGVARDFAAAVRWWRKAAEQGLAEAQYYLGLLYGGGQWIARDEVAAYKWYSLAAAQGHEGARTLRDAIASAIATKQIAQTQ